jgi:hypothetical protein
MSKIQFEVIVGNLGIVYQGKSHRDANKLFRVYRRKSQISDGRVANENVVIFRNGEPIRIYEPENIEEYES